MKRSELERKMLCALDHSTASCAVAVVDNAVERGELPPWDPEEPEGFEGFWLDPAMNGLRVRANRHACLAAWNACLSRQEAQQRAIEPKVDPEVRRKEIEAQIDAWLENYGITIKTPPLQLSRDALRGMARRLLGVL